MDIYKKRINFKPFEYPHLANYRDINVDARWHAKEFDFSEDIQDYHITLNDIERNVAKKTMLAISQIEAGNIKTYWKDINNDFPKPEIARTGITFAENEIVHEESYSMLLEILGFNMDFEDLLKNPLIEGRVNYLNKYLKGEVDGDKRQFAALKLVLFTLFVENVSLFSQFLILKSFRKHKNLLKGIENVVTATQKDELLHAKFGVDMILIIKEENPEWFNQDFYQKIYDACIKAHAAEEKILEWIFEEGDLEFLKLSEIKNFIRHRFNESLVEIGGEPIFDYDSEELKSVDWFIKEIYAYNRNDFFNTKSTNYNNVVVNSKDVLEGVRRIKSEMV